MGIVDVLGLLFQFGLFLLALIALMVNIVQAIVSKKN